MVSGIGGGVVRRKCTEGLKLYMHPPLRGRIKTKFYPVALAISLVIIGGLLGYDASLGLQGTGRLPS
jgi:hypothetical protein